MCIRDRLETLDDVTLGDTNVQSDWNESDSSSHAYIQNKPTIPTIPGNATEDDAGLMSSSDKTKLNGIDSGAEVNVKSDWNADSGDAEILNKPSIPTLPGNATESNHGFMTSSDKTKLNGIQSGAEDNVNADWDADSGDAEILNKPTIPDSADDITGPNTPLSLIHI